MEASPMVQAKVVESGGEAVGKLCMICQTSLVAGESYVDCPDCQMPFHNECWAENRGCSQYGCKSAPQTEKENQAVVAPSTVWGDSKNCPNCRKKIKGNAMKCRFCGTEFGTREALSREEFMRREYTGKEYTSARNKVLAMFLLSGSGILSPILAVLNGILIFAGSFAGIEFKRLPPAMRAISYAGFGLSCFATLFLFTFTILD